MIDHMPFKASVINTLQFWVFFRSVFRKIQSNFALILGGPQRQDSKTKFKKNLKSSLLLQCPEAPYPPYF